MQNRFRPQRIDRKYIIKHRRLYKRSESYNFQSRVEWYPIGWKFNQRVISKQFSKLHYLACHAPMPIAVKWRFVYNTFYKKYFGAQASVRFLNKYTAHNWL